MLDEFHLILQFSQFIVRLSIQAILHALQNTNIMLDPSLPSDHIFQLLLHLELPRLFFGFPHPQSDAATYRADSETDHGRHEHGTRRVGCARHGHDKLTAQTIRAAAASTTPSSLLGHAPTVASFVSFNVHVHESYTFELNNLHPLRLLPHHHCTISSICIDQL